MTTTVSAEAMKTLEKIRYHQYAEWQALHSSEQKHVDELEAAGLVRQWRQFVTVA